MSSFSFRPAVRANIPLLIGLAGGTGAGKTWSALTLATGLARGEKFGLIDTESGRALHYADEFSFDHAELGPPFRPEAYAEAIAAADDAGYPVIVVDSFSHEHAGDGGLLDFHESEYQRLGGNDKVKMTAWIKPKMAHRKMVSKLLQVRAHLILCLRAQESVEVVKVDGKTVVRPKQTLTGLNGWVPICERNLPFELTASFLLTADAPGVPKPIKLPEQFKPFFPLDAPISEAAGRALGEWAAGAKIPARGATGAGFLPDNAEDASASGPAPANSSASADGDASSPVGEPSSAGSARVSEAEDLAGQLVAAATVLGAGESTVVAIAKNAETHGDRPDLHQAWLARQLAKVNEAISEREAEALTEGEPVAGAVESRPSLSSGSPSVSAEESLFQAPVPRASRA